MRQLRMTPPFCSLRSPMPADCCSCACATSANRSSPQTALIVRLLLEDHIVDQDHAVLGRALFAISTDADGCQFPQDVLRVDAILNPRRLRQAFQRDHVSVESCLDAYGQLRKTGGDVDALSVADELHA